MGSLALLGFDNQHVDFGNFCAGDEKGDCTKSVQMTVFTALLMGAIPVSLFAWIGSRVRTGTNEMQDSERWLLFLLGVITLLMGGMLTSILASDNRALHLSSSSCHAYGALLRRFYCTFFQGREPGLTII